MGTSACDAPLSLLVPLTVPWQSKRAKILQLEIELAQERRAAAEAEQRGKKTAAEGGEPTLEFGLRGTGNLKRSKQRATVTKKIETFADLDEWATVHAMYSDATTAADMFDLLADDEPDTLVALPKPEEFAHTQKPLTLTVGPGQPPNSPLDFAVPQKNLPTKRGPLWISESGYFDLGK